MLDLVSPTIMSVIRRMLSGVVLCLLSCLSLAQADPLRVQVVLSERGGAYQEYSDVLHNELKTQSVVLSVGTVGESAGEVDLIVAVGMRSATASAGSTIPVLSVLVPKAGYDRLSKAAGSRASAIYLDQPLERQLSFMRAVLPKLKHIGVLYAAAPPELSNLRHLLTGNHLLLHEQVVGHGQTLFDALDSVLDESEVLLVLPDSEVFNAGTIRNILLASYRKHVPLIGISPAYVKAGALCAIYSTPAQSAAQTAEIVRQFSLSRQLPPSHYPKEFDISINAQVARSLDLPMKDAEELRAEVRRVP